jgi:hypothetical protein
MVVTIGVRYIFSVIKGGVIVSNVAEIIFIIDIAIIRFSLLQTTFSESNFTSINTI